MRGLRNAINQMRFVQGNNVLVGAFFGLGLLTFGFLGLTQLTTSVKAADCSDNSIMRCGANTATEFKNKCNANAEGDLKAIYGHYRIPCDIKVVEGRSYKDNTVRVNGKVVATNAQSIGRIKKSGDHAIAIAGKTYWEAPNSSAFKTDGLRTFVALDKDGNFLYAVLADCGNPVYAKPVPPAPKPQPKYSCDSLTVNAITVAKKRFTASASASNGAQVVGYVFDFGDGKTQESTTATVDHEYAPGTYTAKVSAKISVDGKVQLVDGPKCVAKVEVKAPAAVDCTALTALTKGNNKYEFTITKTHTNATYKGATLDFGDGNTTSITGTTALHQYAKPGNYTITAALSFDVDGEIKKATCQTQVTMEVCPTNPNLPKDDPKCVPCPENPELPADSPDCVEPPVTPPEEPPVEELPQTGMGNMMIGGFGAGSMIISASLYAGSRRDLLGALLNR
ncbi:MAG: PKD domain-containing protein [Candidatus Saccharimonadales bacterium]